MKLYLSSYRIGNDPQSLANLIGHNKKIAIIANAHDVYTDIVRKESSLQREKDSLIEIGLQPENLDLKKYFNKPKDLENKMKEYGAVWVLGGNTFVLRRAYKASGFDTWLQQQKNNKDFVYAGYSAGVCVLSPSLKGLEIIDDSIIVEKNYPKETVWEGLNIIDFAFAPHYKSPGHKETELVEKTIEYYKKNNIKYKALHDGEVIIMKS
ncbi:Peptidase E [bioreactor metagenome]|uniref:Peptidase E n=1 Tax=bioreactor metagenome TaxID=1076179 RepID=A0A645AEL7_9ZZZZ